MNTALIIDNELHDAEKLAREIKKLDHKISIGGILESVEQSVEWLEQNPSPDLIFMDINLKDGNSFNLFNRYHIKCPVIFTVYYDEQMIRTFHEKQINYLLKPFNHETFCGMVTKVRNNQLKNINCNLSLRNSLLRSENAYLSRFVIKSGNEYIVIPVKDIAYFKVQHRIVFVVTSDNKKYVSNKPLHVLNEELDPSNFYRVTRQLIINGNYISSFRSLPDNNMRLKLKVNLPDEIIISRFGSGRFIEWIEKCGEA
jgi:DNA-binding LytR/AlgR family response regulator